MTARACRDPLGCANADPADRAAAVAGRRADAKGPAVLEDAPGRPGARHREWLPADRPGWPLTRVDAPTAHEPSAGNVAVIDAYDALPEQDAATEDDLMALQRWLATASGRWSIPILDCLAQRPTRYNGLLGRLERVSPKVLTQTLRRLEDDGLVAWEPVGKGGRRYSLTDRGRSLREQLDPLRHWAAGER